VSVQAGLILDHRLAECGGPVVGRVSWTGNRKLDRVGVVLRYRTEGRGDVDAARSPTTSWARPRAATRDSGSTCRRSGR
jgi:hypothetical protein